MTTITAKIIADSIQAEPDDPEFLDHETRLTTMQLRYPRCIHAELMTHRQFSRNASSSRAIPVERLIQDVLDDPFIPLHWGKNQKGMQADEECSNPVVLNDHEPRYTNEGAWLALRDKAIKGARAFSAAGYHKQIVNRILEPYAHINVIVTSSYWSNFLALRDHDDAEPHIAILAQQIRYALDGSKPRRLKIGQWHLPYITDDDACDVDRRFASLSLDERMRILCHVSAARCARVSYTTHDNKKPDFDQDIQLAAKLLSSVPLHASPAEHQATPHDHDDPAHVILASSNLHPAWVQYRKTLANECQ
jgi:hypothetical protein